MLCDLFEAPEDACMRSTAVYDIDEVRRSDQAMACVAE
jgi:hypothetical protein